MYRRIKDRDAAGVLDAGGACRQYQRLADKIHTWDGCVKGGKRVWHRSSAFYPTTAISNIFSAASEKIAKRQQAENNLPDEPKRLSCTLL